MFVRAAEEGKRWRGGKGAVIKLCKYSGGLSIINEALIRFDADHTVSEAGPARECASSSEDSTLPPALDSQR